MKKALALLAVFVFFALLFGCPKTNGGGTTENPPVVVVPTTPNVTKNETVVPKGPCEDKGNVLEKDKCLKDLALANSDRSICAKIYAVDVRDDCILTFAANGPGVCDEISDGGKKDSCLDINARKQGSVQLCDRIGAADVRLACVNAVSPPCLAMADPEERQTCMAIAYQNMSACQSDACFFQYGIEKNDTAACEKLSLKAKQTACLSLAAGGVRCQELTLLPDIDYCYELVAEAKQDVNYCDLASPKSSYQTDCYSNVAIEKRMPDYCRKPPMEYDQNSCYLKYALETGETDWCSNISYSLRHDGCYRQAAIKFNNPEICNGIPIGAERTSCYSLVLSSDLAFKPENCDGIVSPEWKDTCYYRVAVQQKAIMWCDWIVSDTTKLNCKDKFVQ